MKTKRKRSRRKEGGRRRRRQVRHESEVVGFEMLRAGFGFSRLTATFLSHLNVLDRFCTDRWHTRPSPVLDPALALSIKLDPWVTNPRCKDAARWHACKNAPLPTGSICRLVWVLAFLQALWGVVVVVTREEGTLLFCDRSIDRSINRSSSMRQQRTPVRLTPSPDVLLPRSCVVEIVVLLLPA